MFHTLNIKQFRCFEQKDIILGKLLTVLAGRNSTGKSTILGMLGNSAEMKKGEGCTYFSKQFRADFGELFKGSKDYDKSGSDKYKVILSDDDGNPYDYRQFRITWQNQGKRFRIIPYKSENGKKTDAKFDIPVYYLGLSRLFPIGEAKPENITASTIKFDVPEQEKWFVQKYIEILSLHDTITSVSRASIGETENKKAVGVNTNTYDYLSNSSGQDNVGQILLALLSFKRIKSSISPWRGGLLLIDEFDSTLHPSAQNKLLDIILKEAREIGIQIVFTTHSISLLKHICVKTAHNIDNRGNNVELYYFTNANNALWIRRNIAFEIIEGDLLVQSAIQTRKKIKLYSEDAEARWFLAHLLSNYQQFIEVLDVSLGCRELLNLLQADRIYFSNVIIAFDGDVVIDADSQRIISRSMNVIKLPGDVRPEEVIYKYLLNLQSDHSYWEEGASSGFSWDYFNENGPGSPQFSQGVEREQYKNWFNAHRVDFDATKLFAFWAEDNAVVVSEFLVSFKSAYNSVADRLSVPRLP
jgi:predicted ATPase